MSRGALGHRRVEVQRQLRDPPRAEQPVQLPHDVLRPADRERRDEQDALLAHDVVDDLGEHVDRDLGRLVLPAAVRGLADHEVRLGDRRGVAEDRRPGPPEVAGEHDHRVPAAVGAREAHPDQRRAEDVPRVEQRDVDALGRLVRGVVRDRPEQRQREVDLVLGVQRAVELDDHLRARGTQQLLRVRAARRRGPFRGQLRRASSNTACAFSSSAAARSGSRRSRRASRFANSTWSFAESSSTSRASSAVAAVHTIEPRNPCATSSGSSPQWSRWAWVRTTASSVAGSNPSGTRLRIVSAGPPWNMPQSMRTRARPVSSEEARPGDRARAAEEGELHGADRDTRAHRRAGSWNHGRMTGNEHVARAEAAYLEARSAHDRLDVARARGEPAGHDGARGRGGGRDGRGARARSMPSRRTACRADDAVAVATMREGLVTAASYSLPGIEAAEPRERRPGPGRVHPPRPRARCGVRGRRPRALTLDGRPVTRLQVLAMLAEEPDAARRRELLLALEPLWRSVDGDGGPGSPYRALIAASVERWRAGRSPIDANARALGVTADDIATWATTALEGWRTAIRRAGAGPRRAAGGAVGLVVARGRGASPGQRCPPARRRSSRSTPRSMRSLGVDVGGARRRVRHPGARRPAACPRRVHRPSGSGRTSVPTARWHPGRPTILESLTGGGLGELAELVARDGARDPHRGHPDAARVHRLAGLGCAHRGARRSRGSRACTTRPGSAAGSRAASRRRARPRDAAASPRPRSTPRGPCSRSASTRRPTAPRTTCGPRSPRPGSGSRPTRSGRGGRCAASSSRSPGTWPTTRSGRCSRRTSGRRSGRRAATGSTATPAGTRGSGSTSTGSGGSAPRVTCCATCSAGGRPRPRCAPSSRVRPPSRSAR